MDIEDLSTESIEKYLEKKKKEEVEEKQSVFDGSAFRFQVIGSDINIESKSHKTNITLCSTKSFDALIKALKKIGRL